MFAPERVSVSLQASRGLAAVLGIVHGAGSAVPWLVGLPPAMAAGVTVGILALGGLAITRDALRLWPTSVAALALESDGTGTVTLRSGRTETVRLGGEATVVPLAVVLSLQGAGRRRLGVVVTRDACGEVEFRHLRVFLRWRVRAAPPQDGTGR